MPADGYSTGDAIKAVQETAVQALPKGYGYDLQVNVILQSEHPCEEETSHQSARHTQKHGERNDKAVRL